VATQVGPAHRVQADLYGYWAVGTSARRGELVVAARDSGHGWDWRVGPPVVELVRDDRMRAIPVGSETRGHAGLWKI